jgi:rhamnulokinase
MQKDDTTMHTAVAQLIARAHRLGADPRNTNYAGGNASAKGTGLDPVSADPVELMWVKGSGGDLGTLTEAGLAVLRPDRLRALAEAYPGVEREDEMVAAFDHCLHGRGGAEETNASTTGLFDARTGTWAVDLAERLGISPHLLPPLRRPGDLAGLLSPESAEHTGLPRTAPVTVVASHDTASAIVAVPATRPAFAYISCGTWSLAGLELDAPILTEASRAANFTNERGIDGTVRYLRNIMGLWLLEECRRAWANIRRPTHLARLLADTARSEPFAALIDPDAPEFPAPGDMPRRIDEYCLRTGQRAPADQGAMVRTILESLALAHRRTLRQAAEISGRDIEVIHLVGGGSRNDLLCRLTADATGLPVVAGPTEATALGNILVQARTHAGAGDLPELRRLVAETQPLRHYAPSGDERAWAAAAARVGLA